ncbi:hypothetical protein [Burkholderia sp. LMG 13014]|uniref:hypothetical protein n=1 Tax=Burkholderia sp. LMG 13014 TaxID=2709306 RepID=UPI001963C607|nr:hypothetical protein [Burkholderia sp. LMG 13014]
MTTDKRRADALTAMADDMRAEQTYLGSCREACDNSGRIRWDRLQRVIDHLTASPVEQHEAAPADDARECLMDVVSHHGDFEKACRALKDAASDDGNGSDASYWLHQIDVLGRMKAQAERALAAPSAPLEGTGNGADDLCRLRNGLENCIENARLRNDAYDVGYMTEMLSTLNGIIARAPRTEVAGAVATKPIAWVRYRSDGGFEGPIMDTDERMCDTRRESGAWTPLYDRPALSAIPAGWMLVPKHRGTKPLAELIIAASLACVENRLMDDDDRREFAQYADQVQHAPQPPSADAAAAPGSAIRERIARALHYPACWDTAAYPTLESAAWEAIAAAKIGCSACEAAPADERDVIEPLTEPVSIAKAMLGGMRARVGGNGESTTAFLVNIQIASWGYPTEWVKGCVFGFNRAAKWMQSALLEYQSAQAASQPAAEAGQEAVAYVCSSSNDFAPIVRDKDSAQRLSDAHGDGKIVPLYTAPPAQVATRQGADDAIDYAIQVLRQVEAGDGTFVGQCADAIAGLEDLLEGAKR